MLRCYYNFVRPHRALKFGRETRTPAMQAGLTTRRLTLREIFVCTPTSLSILIEPDINRARRDGVRRPTCAGDRGCRNAPGGVVTLDGGSTAFVELEPVWEGAYYVDGHFCGYSGGRPLPKGWNAKRRMVETGQSDVYVHDASGRALFFINRPLNEHLSKVASKGCGGDPTYIQRREDFAHFRSGRIQRSFIQIIELTRNRIHNLLERT